MPVPGEPPVVRMRGRARDVLVQIVRAACPSDLDALGLTETIVRYVEETLAYAPPLLARALPAGLLAVEAASWIDNRGRPFSRLPLPEARTYVERSGHGPNLPRTIVVRQVRMLALLGYFEHPLVKERLGYDPDRWIAKVKAERLVRYAHDLR